MMVRFCLCHGGGGDRRRYGSPFLCTGTLWFASVFARGGSSLSLLRGAQTDGRGFARHDGSPLSLPRGGSSLSLPLAVEETGGRGFARGYGPRGQTDGCGFARHDGSPLSLPRGWRRQVAVALPDMMVRFCLCHGGGGDRRLWLCPTFWFLRDILVRLCLCHGMAVRLCLCHWGRRRQVAVAAGGGHCSAPPCSAPSLPLCSEGIGFLPRGRLRRASPTSPMSLFWLSRPGPAFCLCTASRHIGARASFAFLGGRFGWEQPHTRATVCRHATFQGRQCPAERRPRRDCRCAFCLGWRQPRQVPQRQKKPLRARRARARDWAR